MGGFQIPMPQMIPGGGGVSSGGVVGPNASAMQTANANTQALSQLLSGAVSLVAGRKQAAKSEVDKTLAELSRGDITMEMIDQQKLLKQIKRAYPMLKTSYSPEELAAQEHAKQIEQTNQQQNQQVAQATPQGPPSWDGMPSTGQMAADLTPGRFNPSNGEPYTNTGAPWHQGQLPAFPNGDLLISASPLNNVSHWGSAAQTQGGQALSGMPGALGIPGSQMQQPVQPLPPPMRPAPPASSPGIMDKLKGMIPGMGPQGPQPTMNSPVGQMLTRMGQEGVTRHTAALEEEKIGHALTMIGKAVGVQGAGNQLQLGGDMFQRMLAGDPNATEMLYKTGQLKEMPIDTMVSIMTKANPSMPLDKAQQQAAQTMLFMQTGGAQLKGQMMGLVEKMLPYYGGDPNRAMAALQDPVNGPKPTLSVEDNDKLWSGMTRLMDAYQDVPINLVSQYAHAQVAGQKVLADNVLDFISKNYKRTAGDKAGREWANVGVDQKRLGLMGRQIDGELRIRTAAEETQRLRALMEGLKEIGKPAEHIYLNQDKFNKSQILEATRLLGDTNKDVAILLRKFGGIAPTTEVREQGGFESGANLFGPSTPSLGMRDPGSVRAPQGDWFSPMMGQNPTANPQMQSQWDPITENIKGQLRSFPKASRDAILSQMRLPPAVKRDLESWDPEKEQANAVSDFAQRNQQR